MQTDFGTATISLRAAITASHKAYKLMFIIYQHATSLVNKDEYKAVAREAQAISQQLYS